MQVGQVDFPVIDGQIQAFNPARAVHEAVGQVVAEFRLQVRVTTVKGTQLGVGLRHTDTECTTETGGQAGRGVTRSVPVGARRIDAARITDRREAFATTAVQIESRRRAEAFAIGGAEHQVIERLPFQAVHGVGRGARIGGNGVETDFTDGAVIRFAHGSTEFEFLGHEHIFKQRDGDFGEVFSDFRLAIGRFLEVIRGAARRHQGVRLVEGHVFAVFETDGKAHHAGREFEDIAGQATGVVVGGVAGGTHLGVADIVDHLLDFSRSDHTTHRGAVDLAT